MVLGTLYAANIVDCVIDSAADVIDDVMVGGN